MTFDISFYVIMVKTYDFHFDPLKKIPNYFKIIAQCNFVFEMLRRLKTLDFSKFGFLRLFRDQRGCPFWSSFNVLPGCSNGPFDAENCLTWSSQVQRIFLPKTSYLSSTPIIGMKFFKKAKFLKIRHSDFFQHFSEKLETQLRSLVTSQPWKLLKVVNMHSFKVLHPT